jgi:esterase D, putative
MICKLNQVSINKSFDGFQRVLSHFSDTLKCEMKFSLYQPASASSSPVPVIYYLSGIGLDYFLLFSFASELNLIVDSYQLLIISTII